MKNENGQKTVIARKKRFGDEEYGATPSPPDLCMYIGACGYGVTVATVKPPKTRQTTTTTIKTTTTVTTTTLRTKSFSMFNAFFDVIGNKIKTPMIQNTELTTLKLRKTTSPSTRFISRTTSSSFTLAEISPSKTYQSTISSQDSKTENSKVITSQSVPEKMVQNSFAQQKKKINWASNGYFHIYLTSFKNIQPI